MSITGLDAATLARGLRRMAGDGSVEWVMEPIQSSVLLDVADALDESAKLREQVDAAHMSRLLTENENESLRELVWDMWLHSYCSIAKTREEDEHHIESVIGRMRELGIEVES